MQGDSPQRRQEPWPWRPLLHWACHLYQVLALPKVSVCFFSNGKIASWTYWFLQTKCGRPCWEMILFKAWKQNPKHLWERTSSSDVILISHYHLTPKYSRWREELQTGKCEGDSILVSLECKESRLKHQPGHATKMWPWTSTFTSVFLSEQWAQCYLGHRVGARLKWQDVEKALSVMPGRKTNSSHPSKRWTF